MKFAVSQIQKEALHQPFVFSQTLNVAELEKMNNDIRKIEPVQVQGECTLEKNEFIFSLQITGTMILPCARTLVDVDYPFDIHTIEVFLLADALTKEDEENDVYLIEGNVIDLKPCILENIILNIPYRVFSKDEDIQKNAPFKGEGWELTYEEERVENPSKIDEVDPRLKKLKVFLKNEPKDS